MTEVTVAALSEMVGGRLVGGGDARVVGLADLRTARSDQIGFVRHPRYYEAAAQTEAAALLALEEFPTKASLIVVADVDVAYAKVATWFHPLPLAKEDRIP